MRRHYERKQMLKMGFFQTIFLFVISCLWSFLENARQVLLFLLHANNDHGNLENIYPPLKITRTSPQFITHSDKEISCGLCDDHNQVDEPHETKVDISSPALDPTPSKTHHRYRPLKLPRILHNSPPKHYEYLPMFDGEPDCISVEKHIQGFENFIDFFEIEHEDVCMRTFSQYLKGDTKD
jgi:hypothetical protein